MIISKLRIKKVLNYLKDKGISREKLDRVYTPIGLDIGTETLAEIAVAIMEEIIEVKNKAKWYGIYPDELFEMILDNKYDKIFKSLVTIILRRGSAPREVGTKMLVLKDGSMVGTIGGGCVEANIMQAAFTTMDNKDCQFIDEVDMTGIDAEEEGIVCGGIIELFVEPIY